MKPTTTKESHLECTLLEKFINFLPPLIQQSKFKRQCEKISDFEWIEAGLIRTIFQEPSGRGFLQSLADMGKNLIKRSTFFESLKSTRRLLLCQDVTRLHLKQLKKSINSDDPLKAYPELDGYDIYAGDGHYHTAAVHDIKKDGKKHPTLHFYSLDLRTHGLNHMSIADTKGKRKSEHDMRALKRLSFKDLRQDAPTGRKVIYVWDRAGIDFQQWYNWKQSAGIYFISREKSNMRLATLANLDIDHTSPINNGVESDEIVGSSNGTSMRRIRYTCPMSGITYTFLTNLMNIAPGLIAYLYKLRWDIEKVFDQIKNKMIEKKAWATSDTAKTMQAQFICMAHNSMLFLEDQLKTEEGIENKIEMKRKTERFNEEIAKIQKAEGKVPVCLFKLPRCTVRSIKFLRWLRNNIYKLTSWRPALDALRLAYDDF